MRGREQQIGSGKAWVTRKIAGDQVKSGVGVGGNKMRCQAGRACNESHEQWQNYKEHLGEASVERKM